uniref:F-box/FBD/LRR-repeat protein At1g16930-like n=1 Tax=Erigeron canadensis TaxID=72917 RepID=UPI001CB99E7D|nr:F-box/FBD/LRR-repeat protein At1g16930-like [Erigeron canadensis]
MDCRHRKLIRVRRKDDAEGDDRLSSLPDELIHKILSFVSIKHSIRVSALSSRWRYIWTSLPYLSFSTEYFHTLSDFSKFVTQVLTRRGNQSEVYSVKLSFSGSVEDVSFKNIIHYAFSHNVQELNVRCLLENKDIEPPLSLFTSKSLKHLSLIGSRHFVTSTWELPEITTLHLQCVTFSQNIDHFSKCVNLRNLSLICCEVMGSDCFSIFHRGLSNLTIDNNAFKKVHLVVPQLRNLSVTDYNGTYTISAPELNSLSYAGYSPLIFFKDNILSLEKVDILVHHPEMLHPGSIVGLLQKLHGVKSITLNLEIMEHLSSFVKISSHQASSLASLRNLKVYPLDSYKSEHQNQVITLPTEVSNYFLNSSPSATLTMVSRKEMTAIRNAVSAEKLMGELQELLEQWQAKSETRLARVERVKFKSNNAKFHEQEKAFVEMNRPWYFRERMAHIESYWKDLNVELKEGNTKTCRIISKLREIEELLTKLPPLKRSNIQSRFSRLCAESDICEDFGLDPAKEKEELRSNLGETGQFMVLDDGSNEKVPIVVEGTPVSQIL